MASNHTIVLKKRGTNQYDEYECSGVFKPGHYLMLDSSNKVKKHNVPGGIGERLFATEDALQGKTITGSFVIGEVGFVHHAMPGDIIHARLAAAAAAVVKGNTLISAGDGTLANAAVQVYSNVAASAAISNTTAETAFDKTYTIPAGSLVAGDVINIRAQAIATATNSTDTLNVKLKIGSTLIVESGALDVANNDIVYIDATLIVRTVGASGTFVASGLVTIGVVGTATVKTFFVASTAIDTTTSKLISVTGTWSVASASNSVRLDLLTVGRSAVAGGGLVAIANESVDNSAGVAEAFCAVRVL